MHALKTFKGLDEPNDFATTSLIPATSHTALIGPPAIIPVPEGADLNKTLPAPSLDKKITKVYFDRGMYKYHGRIKYFADALRKRGLIF